MHETIEISDAQDVMAYLAGPPVMVEVATALLAARGLAPRQIHADAFYNQS